MTPSPSLTVERIDDLPLLLAQMERMGIRELLDLHFPVHGHWLGLSLGWTATLWLTHLLSAGDHRLNQVEPWAAAHLTTLRQCTAQFVDRLDLTDDRLAAILRALADDHHWAAFEYALTSRRLSRLRPGGRPGAARHDHRQQRAARHGGRAVPVRLQQGSPPRSAAGEDRSGHPRPAGAAAGHDGGPRQPGR